MLTLYCRLNVDVECVGCQDRLLQFEMGNNLEIGESPNVPTLIPVRIQLCGIRVIVQNLGGIVLHLGTSAVGHMESEVAQPLTTTQSS